MDWINYLILDIIVMLSPLTFWLAVSLGEKIAQKEFNKNSNKGDKE